MHEIKLKFDLLSLVVNSKYPRVHSKYTSTTQYEKNINGLQLN
jgi:hypothetical protein